METAPDILARIEATKRREIAQARLVEEGAAWRRRARDAPPPRDFVGALRAAHRDERPALIAEIKKASPSKGLIRADFDPAALARAYQEGGAACLSVLTDAEHFAGDPQHLRDARAACGLPVLRKDFMYVPEQVWQARSWGADCILVIMTAVDDATARALVDTAAECGMAALLEVHDDADLTRALALPSPLVGINNRDLRTFRTELAVTERLAARVPADRIVISESGIASHDEVARLERRGVATFLVGESLMRQPDVAAATRALLGIDRGVGRADGATATTPANANAMASGGTPAAGRLTHLDDSGAARMVNVVDKPVTERVAVAEGAVVMNAETLALISAGNLKKGDVIAVARVAGIMAAKRTADVIPLCHPIPLDAVTVEFVPDTALPGYRITARTVTAGRTGVEMEALTAVSAACLTLYDMAKAVDRAMEIGPIRLVEKSGGRSGDWRRGA